LTSFALFSKQSNMSEI